MRSFAAALPVVLALQHEQALGLAVMVVFLLNSAGYIDIKFIEQMEFIARCRQALDAS